MFNAPVSHTARSWGKAELRAAIGDRTAAIFHSAQAQSVPGSIPPIDAARMAGAAGVPLLVDAAAELPPRSNVGAYLQAGADLMIFTGGKDLRGPQATGLILGARNLVRACRANNFPSYSVGRPMKVGMGAAVGLLRAVEAYLAQDAGARVAAWEQIVRYSVSELSAIPGVKAWRGFPHAPGVQPVSLPRAFVEIDPAVGKRTVETISTALEAGDPGVVTDRFSDGLVLIPQLLEEGQARVVVQRLKAILGSS
jgi:seryl-tRNA(Sec) selenium transferase